VIDLPGGRWRAQATVDARQVNAGVEAVLMGEVVVHRAAGVAADVTDDDTSCVRGWAARYARVTARIVRIVLVSV